MSNSHLKTTDPAAGLDQVDLSQEHDNTAIHWKNFHRINWKYLRTPGLRLNSFNILQSTAFFARRKASAKLNTFVAGYLIREIRKPKRHDVVMQLHDWFPAFGGHQPCSSNIIFYLLYKYIDIGRYLLSDNCLFSHLWISLSLFHFLWSF